MQAIMETLFDGVYLILVISIGIIMIRKSHGQKQYLLFGIMAVTLGLGDTFHLIPRAYALCTTGLENYTAALGIGKFITSITMTIFYILLYYVYRIRYHVENQKNLSILVYVLAIIRIILFALLGLVVIVLFYKAAKQHHDQAFRFMWLTIVLSFGFYIPVVLWADTIPMIGMLMIPKTCAYVWTVLIGFKDMKGSIKQ